MAEVKITVDEYEDFLEYFGERWYNDDTGFELIVQKIFKEGLDAFMEEHWKEYREWAQQ